MSIKRHSSLQPQGPGETGRWAVPQIVTTVVFQAKLLTVRHFLCSFDLFVYRTLTGESECDAEGGASNFFAKISIRKTLPSLLIFSSNHRCLLQPLHA